MNELSFTEQEILSQPEVWAETLKGLDMSQVENIFRNRENQILVTGCGSTYFLSQIFASMLTSIGYNAIALPASELLPNSEYLIANPKETTFFAISRSGTTSETVQAVERFKQMGGGKVGVVSCYPDSELALLADVVFGVPASQEQSVAQTRSFTTMLLMCQAIIGTLSGANLSELGTLPAHASRLLSEARDPMRKLARNPKIERFYFLASGRLFGVASEGMLKLKEMSLTSSEAYHSLEFRHGPMSMCDSASAVIALITPESSKRELSVVNDISPLVGEMITIGNGEALDIPESLPTWCRPALYLLPLQLLALERALGKGLSPDSPRHLSAVIRLETAL